jgi:hypothetical protein
MTSKDDLKDLGKDIIDYAKDKLLEEEEMDDKMKDIVGKVLDIYEDEIEKS